MHESLIDARLSFPKIEKWEENNGVDWVGHDYWNIETKK